MFIYHSSSSSSSVCSITYHMQVIGVEPEFAASYTAALKAGKPVPAPITPTLADGLAVPTVGPHAFEVARHYVDECVTCTEKQISIAMLRLIENEKMIVEGGGAAGLAAILPGGQLDRPELKGKNIVVPLCGGNIDSTTLGEATQINVASFMCKQSQKSAYSNQKKILTFSLLITTVLLFFFLFSGRVIDRGLAADNRLCNFTATVSDRPGGIAKLTELLAQEGASIKDIYHERAWLHSNIDQVMVKCVVELQGRDHAKQVKRALKDRGYPLQWFSSEDIC
jgi:threonine dehydratase